ncbi:hypothetical protein BGZ95_009176 [Linnemannia exigua]|uniref:Dynamin-type G domain-containing protein n=1 Tax=Linnemannia exigua TaxID=604196 RepID=A0AAD4DDK4_9FUNG|nr:hypothetical protein BGZ95_009176 [Linnemannia exigua]
MFNGNSEYQAVFDKIGKVHSHGLKHNMSIPQMAIIGDQSSGKSSVLEALTKLSFPRDKGMCTRFAILVNLQRNSTLPRDVMSAKIEGEDAFNKRFAVVEAPVTFEGVIEEAVSLLCKNIDISDKVLELTLSGPTQSPLTIIDLPGFIRTTEDAQDKTLPDSIRTINRRFIQDTRTIILAVVPANADLITSTSLSEASAYDPDGERTIPIVTKPDRIEGGLLLDWIEVVLNRRKTMKMGYLVMRNAGYEQKAQSWDDSCLEEEKFFETDMWRSVPAERKGRVAIREFLSKVLHEHISRELPALKREVDAALDSFKRDLDAMGSPIADTDEARQRLNIANTNLQPRVIAFLSGDNDHKYLASFKKTLIPGSGLDPYFVRPSLLRLYLDYRLAMRNQCRHLPKPEILLLATRRESHDLPGFVSFTAYKNIINEHYLDAWKTITEEHVLNMHDHLSKALSMFISHIADDPACYVFIHVFEQFARAQATSIKTTIQDIFEDESTPFTLSSHYLDVVHRELSKNTSTTSNKDSINSPPPSQTETPQSPQPSQSNLSPPSSHQSEQQQQQQQQKENRWDEDHSTTTESRPSLIGYLTTARERIVDKVLMQTIERYMIKRINDYFTMILKVTNAELLCMLESPSLRRRRQYLKNKIVDLEAILDDI